MKEILKRWEEQHWAYVFEELSKAKIGFTKENIPRIIEHMSFKTRSKRNPDRCTLYLKGISCHPEIKELNCLLCACPHYDTSKEEGGCKVNNSRGKFYTSQKNPAIKVWDCSNCIAYHSPESVELFLEKNIEQLKKLRYG